MAQEEQHSPHLEPDRLLTRKQVAWRLGVCIMTVSRYEKLGKLKAQRFGKRLIRYRLSDVEAMVLPEDYRSTLPNPALLVSGTDLHK